MGAIGLLASVTAPFEIVPPPVPIVCIVSVVMAGLTGVKVALTVVFALGVTVHVVLVPPRVNPVHPVTAVIVLPRFPETVPGADAVIVTVCVLPLRTLILPLTLKTVVLTAVIPAGLTLILPSPEPSSLVVRVTAGLALAVIVAATVVAPLAMTVQDVLLPPVVAPLHPVTLAILPPLKAVMVTVYGVA